MSDKAFIWIGILILAIALMAIFYTGIYKNFDDHLYAMFAKEILQGTFMATNSPYAYAWAFPFFVLLGGIWLTAIEYLSIIALTAILAYRITNSNTTALLSSFIAAILPFMIEYSTRLLPDMLLGLFATLALVFFFSKNNKQWYLSGLICSLALAIKLEALAFIIPFGILCLISQKRRYLLLGLASGLLIFFIPYIFLTHNISLLQGYGSYQSLISPATFTENLKILFEAFGLLNAQGPLIYQVYSLGLTLWLALAGFILAIYKRNYRILAFCFLFWAFLAYMLFGPIQISPYKIPTFITRYLITVAAPLAIAIGYFLDWVYQIGESIKPMLGKVVLFALIMILILSMWQTYYNIYSYNLQIRKGLI